MAKTEMDTAGFTEQLQSSLATAQEQAKSWLGQRDAIASILTNIRDTANRLLQELTGGGADMAVAVRRGRRRGRPPGSKAKRGPGRPPGKAKKGKPGRTEMSDEARAKISAAQKARWAKAKKEKA